MLPDIQPGNTKILYFFNCLLDGMHTISFPEGVYFACGKSGVYYFNWFIIIFFIVFMFNGLATWAFIPASIAC